MAILPNENRVTFFANKVSNDFRRKAFACFAHKIFPNNNNSLLIHRIDNKINMNRYIGFNYPAYDECRQCSAASDIIGFEESKKN